MVAAAFQWRDFLGLFRAKAGVFASMVTLMRGVAFGQIAALLAAPLLTRVFGPEIFGEYSLFVSLVATVGVVSALRYDAAVPLPERNRSAAAVLSVALLAAASISIAAFCVIVLGRYLGLDDLKGRFAFDHPSLLSLGIFVVGVLAAFTSWAIRDSDFARISKSQAVQSGAVGIVQVCVGALLGPSVAALVAVYILVQAIAISILTPRGWSVGIRKIDREMLGSALVRYRHFPKYDAPAVAINTLAAHAPIILFAIWYSGILAGYYAVAVRILSMPITLIGRTLSQSVMPRLIALKETDSFTPAVEAIFRALLSFSIVPFLIVGALSKSYFGVVFGDNWAGAGIVVFWTSIWVAFQFIYSPLSIVLVVLERQKLNLGIQVASFVVRILPVLFFAGGAVGSWAVAGFSLASMVVYQATCLVVLGVSGVPLAKGARTLFVEASISLLIALPAVAAIEMHSIWMLLVTAPVAIYLWIRRTYAQVKSVVI